MPETTVNKYYCSMARYYDIGAAREVLPVEAKPITK